MDYEPSYKILELNPFDDKNTILYKYVYAYELPKSFFTLINGQVYSIHDLLKHHYDQEFTPIDSLMIFYEYAINLDYNYKAWIIKRHHKRVNTDQLTAYNMNDILEWYTATYGKNKILENYFKEFNGDVIYYDGKIEELFKIFNKKADLKILDSLLTQEDYQFLIYEKQITPDQDLLALLNQFKYKYVLLKNIKYDSKSFMTSYHEWIIETHRQYLRDLNVATILHDLHLLLVSDTRLLTSTKTFDHLVKIYNPILLNRKNIPVDSYDGLDLFNEAKLSLQTPFLIYKDSKGKQYYKVYGNDIINLDHPEQNNSIYYYMIKSGKRYDIIYNLNDNQLQLSYTHYKNVPTDITIFPTLDIGNVVDYNMEGYFNIWDVEMDEETLLSTILNNELINKVLFVDDHGKYIYKKSISLKYIPLNTTTVINIDLTQLFFNDDKVVDIPDGKLKLLKRNRKYVPYIQVKFKNVYHDLSFTSFITAIVNPHQIVYKSTKGPSGKINNLNQLLLNLDYKKEKDLDENLKRLKDLAPDAFIEGYANFCDIKKRPLPIDEGEIENFISTKIKEYKLKGNAAIEYTKHAVLTFPIYGSEDQLNLVCDHPDDRYPYLKSTLASKKLGNLDKELYPELPCCKKILPKTTKLTKKEATHITGPSIISTPGSTGEIDTQIKYLLQNYNNDDNHFIRLGVVEPINNTYSFIHCLCLATDDPQYINTKNKSQYVQTVLENLKSINMAITKQELYDLTLEEILTSLNNGDFFDPSLYYRLLEEYFNVNIYVFGLIDTNGSLIIPRFKSFYTRSYKEKQAVLIYRHENQCELIINVLSDTHKMLIFPPNMSKYCHTFLQNVVHTSTISKKDKINVYDNLYYHANHLEFIPNIVGQYIDEDGKMRALTISVDDELMSIFTLPSQPENLPIDMSIYQANMNHVLSVMTQKPTAISVSNNLITGLWFRIYDVEYGEYIPVLPTENTLHIKIGPNNELTKSNIEPKVEQKVGQYAFTKKILNRVLQIIQWLFLLAIYKYDIVNNVEEFFDEYVTIGDLNSHSYDDLIDIPRRLPQYEKFNHYFQYVSEYSPALINKGPKLVMYNEDFYDKVKLYLTSFNLSDNDVPILIRDYYQYLTDFKEFPNTLIFLNNETLNAWQQNHTTIYHQIIPLQPGTTQYTIYPYIYKTNYGKMFIIQNTFNNTLETALSICDYWDNVHINIGPNGNIKGIDFKDVNIYKLNDLQQLELVSVGSKYHVLDYNYRSGRVGHGQYAAMLPL